MIAIAPLCVVVLALLVDRFLSERQAQKERQVLTEAFQDASRKAIRAAMSKNALEYERGEAVAEAVAQSMTTLRDEGPEYVPEGLG